MPVPKLMNRVCASLTAGLSLGFEEMDAVLRSGYEHSTRSEAIYSAIRRYVASLDPAQQGILAACGVGSDSPNEDRSRTTLYDVHCGTWLSKHASGQTLLLDIATTAVIAHLHDRLEREQQAAHSRRIRDILNDSPSSPENTSDWVKEAYASVGYNPMG